VTRDQTAGIYGSLLITALIAVEWKHDVAIDFVAGTLAASIAIFWLAHVWARFINERIRGPLARRRALDLAADEAPMLAAAILPLTVLLASHLGWYDTDTAIALALAVSIAQLFFWGLAVARLAHDRWSLAIGVAFVDGGFGLAIVALKVAVFH